MARSTRQIDEDTGFVVFTKDPTAVLDYSIDWTDELSGDTLASVTWVVPVGITKVSQGEQGAIATIWVSGGTLGATYTIECQANTSLGGLLVKSFLIKLSDT